MLLSCRGPAHRPGHQADGGEAERGQDNRAEREERGLQAESLDRRFLNLSFSRIQFTVDLMPTLIPCRSAFTDRAST